MHGTSLLVTEERVPLSAASRRDRRGLWQRPIRRAQAQARQHAVNLVCHRAQERGWQRQAAFSLNVSPRTLRHWKSRHSQQSLIPRPRGRRPSRMDKATRKELFAHLRMTGPRASVADLRAEFPQVARRELEEILRRFRYWARRTQIGALRWNNVGSVWAMDFTEAPDPIDGDQPYIFAVRDLASGMQLLSLPTRDQTAQTVMDALACLFVEHGPPLVMKSDNGSGFKAHSVRDLLDERDVKLLASPPRTPCYNGACEAGIGSIKRRSHEKSSARGEPGHWTSDDVEAARLQANATSRPHGDNNPTPLEAWHVRQPIHMDQRQAFSHDVHKTMLEVKRDWLYTPDEEIGPATRDRLERESLRRVLVARGYLVVRRRRITLPLKRLKAARIS